MLKETVISRNAAGATTLTHTIAGGTYSAAPTVVTDGFYIRCASGRNYDAYECIFSYDLTATILTLANVRPWF
jgi:ABC-type branched-subunit amino acid transport system ATPase component